MVVFYHVIKMLQRFFKKPNFLKILFLVPAKPGSDALKWADISVFQAEAADRNTIRLFLPGV
jgi:hypothetical protein